MEPVPGGVGEGAGDAVEIVVGLEFEPQPIMRNAIGIIKKNVPIRSMVTSHFAAKMSGETAD